MTYAVRTQPGTRVRHLGQADAAPGGAAVLVFGAAGAAGIAGYFISGKRVLGAVTGMVVAPVLMIWWLRRSVEEAGAKMVEARRVLCAELPDCCPPSREPGMTDEEYEYKLRVCDDILMRFSRGDYSK